MVNLKVEDLRKKAFMLYDGLNGVDKVNLEVKKTGKKEENLTPPEEKALLNAIIKTVFIDYVGFEKTKEILAKDVTHLAGYRMLVVKDDEKVNIHERVTVMKRLAIVTVILIIVLLGCMAYYAMSFNKVESCEGKKSVEARDMCFLSLALSRSNMTFCDKLNTTVQKYNCISQVGIQLNDTRLCKTIPTNTMDYVEAYDRCVTCVAYSLRNKSICAISRNPSKLDECEIQLDRKISLAC